MFAVTSRFSEPLLGEIPNVMAKRSWKVFVVSDHGQVSNVKNLFIPSLPLRHHIAMRREPSPLQDLLSLVNWLRLVMLTKPTVVSAGTPKAGFLGIIASRIAGVPFRVYFLRGLRHEGLAGLPRRIIIATEQIACRLSTHVLVVSESVRQELIKNKMCDPRRIRMLGPGSSHGVDIEKFVPKSDELRQQSRRRLGLDSTIPVLGFVGRITADKGLETLLRAHNSLLEGGVRHKLVIVGPLDKGGRTPLAAIVDSPDIVLAGEVENVVPYYHAIDLLVLPSLREGFPNVILEAAACGVPSVTTAVTGAKDAVINGVTGLIVQPMDSQGLSRAIESLISSPGLLLRLSKNAQARTVQLFRSDDIARHHADFYESLLCEVIESQQTTAHPKGKLPGVRENRDSQR